MIQTAEHITAQDQLRNLYPNLTAEEIEIAQLNLDAYLNVAWEIFEELQEKHQSA
jgi:hypothetical protein